MKILGIETSCDETAAALVLNGRHVVRSAVASQLAVHRPFRGVVPELASRAHVERINDVVEEALGRPACRVDAIAVTTGPGLIGCLLVGAVTARMLGWVRKIPVVGVNHLEGHLFAGLVEHPKLKPPFLGLIVSGGHTELVIFKGYGRYVKIGATRDDAAGEAFDKVANLLGLPFPGGPSIDRMAHSGNPSAVNFPRAWIPGTWDFSFSGLKTSVANYLKDNTLVLSSPRRRGSMDSRPPDVRRTGPPALWRARFRGNDKSRDPSLTDICASFQEAVVDVLVKKTLEAAQTYKFKHVVVGGGVAANRRLRERFLEGGREEGIKVYLPGLSFCTDNAAMIAAAGYYQLKHGLGSREKLEVNADLEIQSWKN